MAETRLACAERCPDSEDGVHVLGEPVRVEALAGSLAYCSCGLSRLCKTDEAAVRLHGLVFSGEGNDE